MPPVGATKKTCTQLRVAELVEVVKKGGADTNQPPHGRIQYVNLDPDNAHPEFGRTIKLKARLQWVSGDPKRSLAGKTVYWYFRKHKHNRKKLPAKMQAGFKNVNAPSKTDKSTTAADGWTPVVEFHLSRYGGDEFDVYATADSGRKGGRHAGTYTVWRKLWYELDCMKRQGGKKTYKNRAYTKSMAKSLGKDQAFIELERSGTVDTPAYERIWTENNVDAKAAAARNHTSKVPRYFHLILIDTIAWDKVNLTETFNLKKGKNTIVLHAGSTDPSEAFSRYTIDPTDWWVSATYNEPATGKSGNLAQGNFTLTEVGDPAAHNDGYQFTVNFTGLGLDRANNNVRVTLTFKNWTEGSGIQSDKSTVIGIRWRERRFGGTDLKASTTNTMIHEPCHAMGLASDTLPDGTNILKSAANPTGTTYHKAGGHCNSTVNGKVNGCVMYEANSTSTSLCRPCRDALRGRNLASLPISGSAPIP
jgi:hypothetical protein